MTDPTAVAEQLEGAADALFVYGRCRTTGQADDGSMCVLGALAYVVPEAVDAFEKRRKCELRPCERWQVMTEHPACIAFGKYLVNHGDIDTSVPEFAPFLWNDRLVPSPENDALVIDTLRRCAKDLRNGEPV